MSLNLASDPNLISAHGQTFLTYVYCLLGRQAYVVPPQATVDGLVAAFRSTDFLALLSKTLTTLALQRVLKSAPMFAPPTVLDQGHVVRVAPWQSPLVESLAPGIHSGTIGLLVQFFLVGSCLTQRADLVVEARRDAETYEALSKALEHESTVAAGTAAKSPWVWARALGSGKTNLEAIAHCPPGRFFSKDDSLGPLDLILLDDMIAAARDVAFKVRDRVDELGKYWNGIADRAVDVSPLTQLLAVDPVAVPQSSASRRGRERCGATLAPLFQHGNHHFLRYLESAIIGSWIQAETERLRLADMQWGTWITHFNDVLIAFQRVAETTRLVSPLTLIPRFYETYFRNFPEDGWVCRIIRAMRTRKRFVDQQAFIQTELAIFEPLAVFDEIVSRLRQTHWTERNAEENFLIMDPASQTLNQRRRVQFCHEKLDLARMIAAS